MPNTHTSSRRPAAAALTILLLVCIGLAACGGSSSGTSSSTNAASTGATSSTSSTGTASTGSTTTPPTGGRGSARFTAMRECLQKNGITLPARPNGAGGPGGPGGFLGGSPTLPKGVTRAQYEAALKKCGGNNHFFRQGRGAAGFSSPAFRQALTKYAACLRQNGINLPAPNTSERGPIFNTKGINTSSPQFKAATTKCRATLLGAFRRRPGTGGAPGSSGAPGAGGPPPGGESSG